MWGGALFFWEAASCRGSGLLQLIQTDEPEGEGHLHLVLQRLWPPGDSCYVNITLFVGLTAEKKYGQAELLGSMS